MVSLSFAPTLLWKQLILFHNMGREWSNKTDLQESNLKQFSLYNGRDENVSLTSTASTVDHRSSTGRRRPS